MKYLNDFIQAAAYYGKRVAECEDAEDDKGRTKYRGLWVSLRDTLWGSPIREDVREAYWRAYIDS